MYIHRYIYIYMYIYIYIPNLCEILAEVPWSPSMVKSGTLLNGLSGSRIEIDGCGSQMHRAPKIVACPPWKSSMVAMVAMVAAQEQVMQSGIRPESIGIISPYGAQVGSRNGHQRTSTGHHGTGEVDPTKLALQRADVRASEHRRCVPRSRGSEFGPLVPGKGHAVIKRGGLPHFTAKIPGKMQENDDQLWSTTKFEVPDSDMPWSC